MMKGATADYKKHIEAYRNFCELTRTGDWFMCKTNIKTQEWMNVGGYTAELNPDICRANKTSADNGYNHIGLIKRDFNDFVRLHHAHPPHASIDTINYAEFCKLVAHNDIEVWRLNEDIPCHANSLIDSFNQITEMEWNDKQKKYIGAGYDWSVYVVAIASIPLFLFKKLLKGLNRGDLWHCAESVFAAYLSQGIVLDIKTVNNPVVTPNSIINSNKAKRVWGYYIKET